MASTEQKLLSYQNLFAEAVNFLSKGSHKKAVEMFSKSYKILTQIESPPEIVQTYIIQTLLHRSKCLVEIGAYPQLALEDALKGYALNENDPNAILAVGEAYYHNGEFEKALIKFHIGKALKPEWKAFEIGVVKCNAVIQSALGSQAFSKYKKKISPPQKKSTLKILAPGGKTQLKSTKKPNDFAELEELSVDRLFMLDLLQDEVFLEGIGSLKTNIEDSIKFLECRAEFWRQKIIHI
jgi:tetratricopeptide (TPR) repeat protein